MRTHLCRQARSFESPRSRTGAYAAVPVPARLKSSKSGVHQGQSGQTTTLHCNDARSKKLLLLFWRVSICLFIYLTLNLSLSITIYSCTLSYIYIYIYIYIYKEGLRGCGWARGSVEVDQERRLVREGVGIALNAPLSTLSRPRAHARTHTGKKGTGRGRGRDRDRDRFAALLMSTIRFEFTLAKVCIRSM